MEHALEIPTEEFARTGHHSLSYPQQWRLAQDFGADPSAFDHTRRFARATQAERTHIRELFAAGSIILTQINSVQAAYDILISVPLPLRDDQLKDRIRESGRNTRILKVAQQAFADKTYQYGCDYATQLATHSQDNLDGAPLRIFGNTYQYVYGHLELEVNEDHLVFASLDIIRQRNRQLKDTSSSVHARRPERMLVTVPGQKHWQTLLAGLDMLACFQRGH